MDEEITLDQFEKKLQDVVGDFVKTYKEGLQTQPDQFDATMTQADWFDQFLAHLQVGEEIEG